MVEQLTEKCQQLQAELQDSKQELEQLQTEHRRVVAEMESLRSKFTLTSIPLAHILCNLTLISVLRASSEYLSVLYRKFTKFLEEKNNLLT